MATGLNSKAKLPLFGMDKKGSSCASVFFIEMVKVNVCFMLLIDYVYLCPGLKKTPLNFLGSGSEGNEVL